MNDVDIEIERRVNQTKNISSYPSIIRVSTCFSICQQDSFSSSSNRFTMDAWLSSLSLFNHLGSKWWCTSRASRIDWLLIIVLNGMLSLSLVLPLTNHHSSSFSFCSFSSLLLLFCSPCRQFSFPVHLSSPLIQRRILELPDRARARQRKKKEGDLLERSPKSSNPILSRYLFNPPREPMLENSNHTITSCESLSALHWPPKKIVFSSS